MTLEEMIANLEQVIKRPHLTGPNDKQLLEWLKELQLLREMHKFDTVFDRGNISARVKLAQESLLFSQKPNDQ